MLRCAASTAGRALARRSVSTSPASHRLWRGSALEPWRGPSSSSALDVFDRQLRDMERTFDRLWREWPAMMSWPRIYDFAEHPTAVESFRLLNPIVEEDGVKKFKLEFDVRRFKPEEVTVTSSSKDGTLLVEAKHADENSKFEFSRRMTLPEGTVASELSCRFTADGRLVVQAPYNPPPKSEPVKDTDIPVKHE